ncbi:hypothetical protein M1116_03495 [Patescibacteria group bacterium]|nr:hypothetical protein [Patescibacteria group bacterium]
MDENTSLGKAIGLWIVIAFVVVIVGGIIAIGFGLLESPLQNLHWQAFQKSDVNIQGLQTTLSQEMANYADFDTKIALYKGNKDVVPGLCGQQKELLRMFYENVDKLTAADSNSVPQSVKDFVKDHPRNSVNPACSEQ